MKMNIASIKQILFNNPKKTIPLFIVGFTFIIIFFMFQNDPVVKKTRGKNDLIPSVDIIIARKETVRIPIQTRGLIEPKTQLGLVSKVTGDVVYVSDSLQAGASFKKGEVLMRVDPILTEIDMHKVRLAYEKAVVEEQQAKALYSTQEAIQKNTDLSDLTLGKPQLAALKTATEGAAIALKLAQEQLKFTTIRAPFDGRVMLLNNIRELQPVAIGSPIAQIYATNAYIVRLPIIQDQLAFVGTGNENSTETSSISVIDPITKQHWEGKVLRSEGIISKARTIYIVAEFYPSADNSNNTIIPGSLVDVEIAGKAIPNIVTLPTKALHENNTVWIINNENRVEIKNVELIHRGIDSVYISSGLESDDKIITSQLVSVIANMEVKVKQKQPIESSSPNKSSASAEAL